MKDYDITESGSPWTVSVDGRRVGRVVETLDGYVPEILDIMGMVARTGPALAFRDSAIHWLLEV